MSKLLGMTFGCWSRFLLAARRLHLCCDQLMEFSSFWLSWFLNLYCSWIVEWNHFNLNISHSFPQSQMLGLGILYFFCHCQVSEQIPSTWTSGFVGVLWVLLLGTTSLPHCFLWPSHWRSCQDWTENGDWSRRVLPCFWSVPPACNFFLHDMGKQSIVGCRFVSICSPCSWFFFRCIFCFGIGDIVSMERAPDACWLLSLAQGKRQKMSEPQVEKQRVLLHVQKHGDCLGFIERNVRFQAEFIFVWWSTEPWLALWYLWCVPIYLWWAKFPARIS